MPTQQPACLPPVPPPLLQGLPGHAAQLTSLTLKPLRGTPVGLCVRWRQVSHLRQLSSLSLTADFSMAASPAGLRALTALTRLRLHGNIHSSPGAWIQPERLPQEVAPALLACTTGLRRLELVAVRVAGALEQHVGSNAAAGAPQTASPQHVGAALGAGRGGTHQTAAGQMAAPVAETAGGAASGDGAGQHPAAVPQGIVGPAPALEPGQQQQQEDEEQGGSAAVQPAHWWDEARIATESGDALRRPLGALLAPRWRQLEELRLHACTVAEDVLAGGWVHGHAGRVLECQTQGVPAGWQGAVGQGMAGGRGGGHSRAVWQWLLAIAHRFSAPAAPSSGFSISAATDSIIVAGNARDAQLCRMQGHVGMWLRFCHMLTPLLIP